MVNDDKTNLNARAQAVITLLSGTRSAREVASEFGVSERELLEARDVYLACVSTQLEAGTHKAKPVATKRAARSVRLAAISGALLLLGGGVALSQATWPITLKTFTPGTPAVADDVNANFSALKAGVTYVNDQTEAKIGAFSNPNVVAKVGLLMGQLGLFYDVNILGGDGSAGFPYRPALRGDRAADTLTLNQNAAYASTLIGSPLGVNGDTSISGNLKVLGLLETDGRLVVQAPYNSGASAGGTASASTAVNHARLTTLCSDIDGCSVTLIMRDFTAAGAATGEDASVGPVHFEYDVPSGVFRSGHGNPGDSNVIVNASGVDGNNSVNHAMRAWNCYFTDATYGVGTDSSSDNTRGMYLLNYNSTASYTPDCVLVIDD